MRADAINPAVSLGLHCKAEFVNKNTARDVSRNSPCESSRVNNVVLFHVDKINVKLLLLADPAQKIAIKTIRLDLCIILG